MTVYKVTKLKIFKTREIRKLNEGNHWLHDGNSWEENDSYNPLLLYNANKLLYFICFDEKGPLTAESELLNTKTQT